MTHAAAERLPMPITYFLLILREFGKTPEERAALVAGTGVEPAQLAEPGAEITLGQQLRQVRNLVRLRAPGWALRAGSGFHAATHGPLGFAALSAPTLGAALELLARYAHVRAPYYRVTAGEDDLGERVLRLHAWVPLEEEERIPLFESLLLSFQALVESVLGEPLPGGRFEVDYPPPSYAASYADHFHAPVRFGASRTAVVLPAEWTRVECPLADPIMVDASVRELESLRRRLESDTHVVARVEHLLDVAGDGGLGLGQAASRLGVSSRTLVRRLGQRGTSFRALLDAHRRERAERLLRDTDFDLGEIGYRLGYGDPANFGRACRRWFGVSPSCHRERLRRPAAPR